MKESVRNTCAAIAVLVFIPGSILITLVVAAGFLVKMSYEFIENYKASREMIEWED